MKRLIVLVALLAAGCGSDTPAAPTPPPPASVAGTWSGTIQYTQSSTGTSLHVQAIALSLTQAGSAVNGTYAAESFNGTVSGTTTPSSFSGSMTFNATTLGGTPCTGTLAVSGGAGGNTMTWTSPAVTASCTNTPVGITIVIQHR